ncbi:MAG TPA: tRNA-dihydrouridine synthase [candidate division Zixibacteria bacterium]|nr:tRNA-dihydrouridine synthase [candidate division Zixibacteria bacterium]
MSFWRAIEKPIVGLSPMDGITDASFRRVTAALGGPDVIFTEFVSVETASFAPHAMLRDLDYSEIERPIVAQIYGRSPEMFYKVAHIVCELGFDGLDINMGCPAKNVAQRGSGAALIEKPDLARSIVRAAIEGVRHWSEGQTLEAIGIDSDLVAAIDRAARMRGGAAAASRRRAIPVSVKTRIGYDRVVVEDWVRHLLEERPAVISLHGRTLKQGYSGEADWGAIARAVAAARGSGTLILGNGDVKDLNDAARRIRETGVDGVLLGRAAQGNPWIFRAKRELKRAMREGERTPVVPAEPTLEERFRAMLDHSRDFERRRGVTAFAAMRKHLAWYCRSCPGAARLRARLVQVASAAEVAACLDDYLAGLDRAAGETLAVARG